jgi:caffeoyl-CoA O-methyltransferase
MNSSFFILASGFPGETVMSRYLLATVVSCLVLAAGLFTGRAGEQKDPDMASLDARVRQALATHRESWSGPSVPEADGQALHNIVVQHGYKNALEIGTSTGYSGIWIAWALAKTGGNLITVEIDRERYQEAVANFRDAGLSKYIDARLGDAHSIVPALPGPFDFVFCDADKDWYENYLKAVLPKLSTGGCFAAHNVSDFGYGRGGGFRRRGYGWGGSGFFEFAKSIPSLDTKILDIPSSAGLSVSYKK